MEKENILKILGENIRILRRSKSLSQEVLAEKLDKSTNFISLLELGKTGVSIETLIQLCNVLETTPNNLLINLYDEKNNNKDTYILNNVSSLSDTDKEIIINLIDYIKENKK